MIVIQVAAGVILNNKKSHVYVTKRKSYQDLAGLWEFPGGKVKEGESIKDALKRELLEEVGIVVKKATEFVKLDFDYPDKKVKLSFYIVDQYLNTPSAQEFQEIVCIEIKNLKNLKMPIANKCVIEKLVCQYRLTG